MQRKPARFMRAARRFAGSVTGGEEPPQSTADDTPAPERWRQDEVRLATAVCLLDDPNFIGVRIEARHHGGGVFTGDNRGGRGDYTPGMAGFDYEYHPLARCLVTQENMGIGIVKKCAKP